MSPVRQDPDRKPPRGGLTRLLIFGAVLAGLVFLLHRLNPTVLGTDGGIARLVYVAMVFVLIAPAALSGHLTGRLRQLAVWAALFLGVALAYGAWEKSPGLRALLAPHYDTADKTGEARFHANRGGDYVVEARIDGTRVMMLVDTGASDVMLTPRDAARVGITVDPGDFTRIYQTANGPAAAAPVTLPRLTVGGVTLHDVHAAVSDGGLGQSLLGMSFLERLDGFTFRDGELTLYQ